MVDIQSMSTGLKAGDDGIWYSQNEQDISYPSGGNEGCFALEDDSFWFRHRNSCITSIVKSFPPQDGGAIFDIGGGNGFVALGLANAGFEVALLEPGSEGASNAKKRGLENVICATTDTAGLKQQSLSAVGLFDVIEHIENDLSFLRSIRNLMKKGGRLYATVPSYRFLWSEEDVNAGHFRRYALKDICRVLESAGFQLEYSTYIFRLLPASIFLFRSLPFKLGLSGKEKSTDSASRDHASQGGSASRMLGSILSQEIKKLDKGKSMRFGGSCLVVAKRP
jgi:SAM-dependent methyltransferase